MKKRYKHILIICDIEGSSGCLSYRHSSFMTDEWSDTCVALSYDVNTVARALLDAGVGRVTVKDFHRTGYNLIPRLIDRRVRIVSGYRTGEVTGIGTVSDADGVFFIGMHAPSGSGGFIAHTMTSRIARITANNTIVGEVELFASALAPFGLTPLFFSGCPVACRHASTALPGIVTFPIDKTKRFDPERWRNGLAQKAVAALGKPGGKIRRSSKKLDIVMTMRGGKSEARKIAHRWKLTADADVVRFTASDLNDLFMKLIRICYLTPLLAKVARFTLPLYNLYGAIGIRWVFLRKRGLLVKRR